MDLYDIHTYNLTNEESDEPSHRRILNVFPLGFEDAVGANENWFFTCGIHPWHSEDAEAQLAFLAEIAGHPRIVAIGEAGMDKLKGPDLQVQKDVFEQHIRLSEALEKPLIIHCVKAWEELLLLRKQYKPRQAWIIHGFRGNPELTNQLVKQGFWFTIGTKFNDEAISNIPLNRLFIETDESETPLEEVYQAVADALSISADALAVRVEENIRELFPTMIPTVHEELHSSKL